jgi:hypothetical protein
VLIASAIGSWISWDELPVSAQIRRGLALAEVNLVFGRCSLWPARYGVQDCTAFQGAWPTSDYRSLSHRKGWCRGYAAVTELDADKRGGGGQIDAIYDLHCTYL